MGYIRKEEYIARFGEEAWEKYLLKKRNAYYKNKEDKTKWEKLLSRSRDAYYKKRNKKRNNFEVPSDAVKATLNDYTYYVTKDGKHFYNSRGKERPIQVNKRRGGRRYIKLNQKTYFFNYIMANAFPEICGQLFEGCEIHHMDGNPQNDAAENLIVISKEEHHQIHDGVIVKYSLSGEKLGEYTSSEEAANSIHNKRTPSAIRECLCGKSKTCGGFIWRRE